MALIIDVHGPEIIHHDSLNVDGDFPINAVGPDPDPPLNMAVMNGDLALVKRLLALGADPLLVDWEGKTAVQRARQIARTFRPKSRMVGCAMLFAKFVNRKEFIKLEKQTQEMVRLLEEATTKCIKN